MNVLLGALIRNQGSCLNLHKILGGRYTLFAVQHSGNLLNAQEILRHCGDTMNCSESLVAGVI